MRERCSEDERERIVEVEKKPLHRYRQEEKSKV